MGTSRIPAAIDWLVATFTAAPTLGKADPPVLVLDGPTPEVNAAAPRLLWVGVDDVDADYAPTGATSTQTWRGLGRMHKDEQLSIPCVARAYTGESSLAVARGDAFGILAAAEDIVRAHADLGGTVLVTLQGITGVRLRQAPLTNGAVAEVAFVIDAKALI